MFISDKSSIVVFVLLCAIGGGLFHIIYLTVALEAKIKTAKLEIATLTKKHQILIAEWQAVSNPERIQYLAGKYLSKNMEPIRVIEADISCSEDRGRKRMQLLNLINEVGHD